MASLMARMMVEIAQARERTTAPLSAHGKVVERRRARRRRRARAVGQPIRAVETEVSAQLDMAMKMASMMALMMLAAASEA